MKLVIVANRLPIVVKSIDPFLASKSPGGLVSGILTFLKKANISNWLWMGWLGTNIKKNDFNKIKEFIHREYNYIPVYISDKLMDRFYNGFCNKTLWPLFHSMPAIATYERINWESYVEVNRIFADTLLQSIDIDTKTYIWIHDYHLMLLPKIIRERVFNANIGFFLHIPFPPPEIFSLLPWKKELLHGLLGSDLIGFHIYEYTINFLRTLVRVLRIESNIRELFYQDRIIRVDTFPMGIDFKLFNSMTGIDDKIENIKKAVSNKKIIFSVDRLDYTKGIYNRLLAYEEFLKTNENFRGKVVLIMNVVPSRENVEHYARMKRQIEEKISQINGTFGNIEWVPVIYQYKSLDIQDLVAYYRASDVILITPFKDGMNLIAKEFVASRSDLKGVLILSEFAGSSKELGEAIIVNPNSIDELCEAIKVALTSSLEEQKSKLKVMQERLEKYDILKWENDFMEAFNIILSKRNFFKTKEIDEIILQKIISNFKISKKKLFLLDYDGTLVAIKNSPGLAILDQEVKEILFKLSNLKDSKVVIISGRRKDQLEEYFKDLNVVVVAEHGCWVRDQYSGSWKATCTPNNEIKKKIKEIMEYYTYKLPFSFVEEKDFTVAFHYRLSEIELAGSRIAELLDELKFLVSNTEYGVLMGNKVLEVRPLAVNKGTISYSFTQQGYDFVLAIGDDTTDEDMFKALPSDSITIKVGLGPSYAKYYLPSQTEVIKLLKKFVEQN